MRYVHHSFQVFVGITLHSSPLKSKLDLMVLVPLQCKRSPLVALLEVRHTVDSNLVN